MRGIPSCRRELLDVLLVEDHGRRSKHQRAVRRTSREGKCELVYIRTRDAYKHA